MQNSKNLGRVALIGDAMKVLFMEAFQVKMDQIVDWRSERRKSKWL